MSSSRDSSCNGENNTEARRCQATRRQGKVSDEGNGAGLGPRQCFRGSVVVRDSSSLAAHLLDPVYACTAVIFVQKPEGKQFSSSFVELYGVGPVCSLMF
jgi:hypothetical protein